MVCLFILRPRCHRRLCKFAPVGKAHIALALQGIVHAECSAHVVAGLTLGRHVEVIPQELTIVGMGTILDDSLGALHGTLAAEVGDTLLGDHDVDTMLIVVYMRYHGHDGADLALLGY